MRSFRTRLALLSALISGLIIAAFSATGFFVFKRLLMEAIDLQLAVPIDRISRELHPYADYGRIFRNADIVYGNDIEEGKLLLLVHKIREDEVLYQNPEDEWLQQVDASVWKKEPDEHEPGRPPPHHEFGKGDRGPPHDEFAPGDRDPPPRAVHPFQHFDHEKGKGKGKGPPEFGDPPDVEYHFLQTGDDHWRVGVQTDRGFTVMMARNLSEFHGEIAEMLRLLFIAAPFGLLLIGAGGWYVGHRAMKPLLAITETASNISTRELQDRIPAKPGESLEFSNLISVLNSMMDRLERGFSHAMRFSADVSHELKTPITIMQAEVNTALKECEPGSNEEKALQVISQETHRLKAITGSLMLLSQAESGRLMTKFDEISLSNEVTDLAEDSEILCETAKLTLETDIQAGITITTDQTLLHQALLNLASNAMKYNKPGGWVRMSLKKHDLSNEAIIRISNSGKGIPEQDQEKIFERFYRVNRARDRDVDGFGLGLNLSFEIISILGGELELVKADSDQTTFQVRLPLG